MIPLAVRSWLEDRDYGGLVTERPVGGGCINNGLILGTASGETFFLKINASSPVDMFAREVEGLEALCTQDGPKVPRPYLHGRDFLLMEDLAPSKRRGDYWEIFGHQMGALHNHPADRFGFHNDNFIGSTPQPNPWMADGHRFFAEQRLRYMAGLAQAKGLLDMDGHRKVEGLAGQLRDLIPEQPPSLLHGDLWSGNAITDSQGSPAIIDPAAHYGWPEAELAMMNLFGSTPQTFFQAYQEVRPLEPGYAGRFQIYNLYHLLNHLYLFGRSYLGQVKTILRRYG